MRHRLAAFLAILLLLLTSVAGSATAFRTQPHEVELAYDRSATPLVLGAGAAAVEGSFAGPWVLGNASDLRFGEVARLSAVEPQAKPLPRNATYRDATLVVHDGDVLWMLEGGFSGRVAAPYALVLGVPNAPVPTGGGNAASAPGLVLVSDDLAPAGAWTGAHTRVVPLDATVSVLDARGEPVSSWDRRRVNAGLGPDEAADPAQLDVVFELRTSALLSGRVSFAAAALGQGANATLTVGPGEEDRFGATLDVLDRMGRAFADADAAGPFGDGPNPLRAFQALSGILNGGLLVIPQGPDGGSVEHTRATMDGEAWEPGRVALLRSDAPMQVAWSADEMRVQGEPMLAMGSNGFVTEPPGTLGALPLASLALWALAAGAIAFFVVRRPPKARTPILWRVGAMLAHLGVFVLAFYLWDKSFAGTFGTSFLTEAAQAESLADMGELTMLLAFQMFPWGLAAVLFALPVRIAGAIGLRYLGRGKGLRGFASAGGLLTLAVVGPFYALWTANLVAQYAMAAFAGV